MNGTARGWFLLAAAMLVIGGLIAVVVLELGAAGRRGRVAPARDVIEVLLPPVMTGLLLWAVWSQWT